MLLTEDREIIDIYNRRILNENIRKPQPAPNIDPNRKIALAVIANFFKNNKINEKHVGNPNFSNPTSGSTFVGYSTSTLEKQLIDVNITWSKPVKDGKDMMMITENFPIGSVQYAELGAESFKNIDKDTEVELHLNGDKLQTVVDSQSNRKATNIVTMIYTQTNWKDPSEVRTKSIYPGLNRLGRNNIFVGKNDEYKGSDMHFIPFARLKSKN